MTNKLIRKLRSNASWSKLSEEQLNALEKWLIEDKLGYEEVLERARKEFGFEGSMSSLKRFYQSARERQLLAELLESAAEAKKVCRVHGESSLMREASVKVLAQQFFERLREEGVMELRSLGELLMRAEANELQRERVEIQRQRQESWERWLSFQESRWQYDLVGEAQKVLPELTRLKREADYAADPYLENRRLNEIRRRMFGPNIPDPAPESAEEEAARNARKNGRPDASA